MRVFDLCVMKTRFTACMVFVGLLSGCGLTVQQKAALDRFATATRDISTAAQAELRQSRRDVVDMNRLRLELGDQTVELARLDAPFTVDRTRDRLAALQALEQYGALLHKLVGAVPPAELLEAGNSLVGNLRQINGVTMTDSEAEGIGKAVAAVGGLYVEHKRASAVRQVVETAHAPVMTVIALVRRDFDPNADDWNAGYREAALNLRGHAAAIAGSVPDKDLASKQSIQRAKTLAAENMDRFQQMSKQMTALTDRLAEAQQKLRLVLDSRDANAQSLDQLASQVQEFRAIYGLLRNDEPR